MTKTESGAWLRFLLLLALLAVVPAKLRAQAVTVSNLAGTVASEPVWLTVLPAPTGPGSVDATFPALLGWEGPDVDRGPGAYDLAPLPDGKVIIRGFFSSVSGTPRNHLARLLPSGELDAGFDPVGVEGLRWDSPRVAVQPDGGLVLGGRFDSGPGGQQVLIRLNADNRLDTTFTPPLDPETSWLGDVVAQPDGRLVVSGWFALPNQSITNQVVRLNADGSVDSSFRFAPELFAPNFSGPFHSLLVQPDGRLLVVGRFSHRDGVREFRGIARLEPDGSLDKGFCVSIEAERVYCLKLQPDGAILVGGRFQSVRSGEETVTCTNLVRLRPDASVDTAFQMGAPYLTVSAMAIQPDGRILVGGGYDGPWTEESDRTHVARLHADGRLDPTFKRGTVTQEFGGGCGVTDLLIQENGKVLVGGYFETYNGVFAPGLVRLNGDATTIVPSALTRFVGGTATFSMDTNWRQPLAYQWLLNGKTLPGATNTTLTITSAQPDDAGCYSVTVTSAAGYANSAEAHLTVLAKASGPGSLDATFDPTLGGEVAGITGDAPSIFAMARAPDGKVVVAGDFGAIDGRLRNSVARFNADGSLDESFSPGYGIDGIVSSAVVQRDGKVVVAGEFSNVNGGLRGGLARFNVDGSLDAAFKPRIGGVTWSGWHKLALQADDKLLLQGHFTVVDGVWRTNLARLNRDGSLDTTFEANPALLEPSAARPLPLLDGGVLVAGHFAGAPGTEPELARLSTNGIRDPGFVLRLPGPHPPSVVNLKGMAQQPDGKVLLNFGGPIYRINADGSADPSFGDVSFDGHPENMVVQEDGKILVCGEFSWVNGVGRGGLARFDPDGRLDMNFTVAPALPTAGSNRSWSLVAADDGTVWVANSWQFGEESMRRLWRFGRQGELDSDFHPQVAGKAWWVSSLAVQPDGKVLVGGRFSGVQGQSRRGIARFHPDGLLDTGFDPGAGVNPGGYVNTVALQADGKVLIGGSFTNVGGLERLGLARLNRDGSVDAGFAPSMATAPAFWRATETIVVQPDGRVLVGGDFGTVNGVDVPGLARLNANGSLDMSFAPELEITEHEYGVRAIALQSDGKVLVGGPGFARPDAEETIGLVRLNPDGSRDTSFVADVSPYVLAIVVQGDGRILLSGENAGVQRLESDGRSDDAFAPEALQEGRCLALALQPDGRILAALRNSGVVRLNPDGSTDRSLMTAEVDWTVCAAIALQADGRILIGGDFSTVENVPFARLARLNNDPPRLPEIATPPTAQTSVPGGAATFAVVAEGPQPLRYQWLFNGVRIPDATNATLTLSQVTPAEVGWYAVQVTGPTGSVLSREASLALPATATGVGAVDPAYDTRIIGSGFVSWFLRQPDGKVLVAGAFTNLGGLSCTDLARLLPDGTLDPSFTVRLEAHSRPAVSAAVVLSDGGILIAGSFTQVNGVSRSTAARLNPDGSLDLGFDLAPGLFDGIGDLAVQSDGKILTAASHVEDGRPVHVVRRFSRNGVLDPTFIVRAEWGMGIGEIVVLPGDRVMIAGEFDQVNGVDLGSVVRLQPDGTVDTSFVSAIRGGEWYRLAPLADGRLLIWGDFYRQAGCHQVSLARLNPDGSWDATFEAALQGIPEAVDVQPDGRILAAGYFQDALGLQRHGLVRLLQDGRLDYTFNSGAGLGGDSFTPWINALLTLPGDKLLVGGDFSGYDGVPVQGLTRLNNPPAPLVGPFVERRIEGVVVQLVAAPPAHVTAYAVEEHLPTMAVNISHGGVWDPIAGKVSFGPFPDHEPRVLSYLVLLTPDGECHRPQAVRGVATAEGVTVPITGESVLGLEEAFPADVCPADGVVNEQELGPYVSAWLTGKAWAQGPNPIPIDYATRVGVLWLARDSYGFDPYTFTNHPALRWLPFGAQFPACMVYPAPLPTGLAERLLPNQFVPGAPLSVSLTVTPADNVSVYAVEEQFPAGWTVLRGSPGDRGWVDEVNRKVKWAPFYDHTPRTLGYVVVPSVDASQGVTFTGTASFDGVNVAVGGASGTAPALSLRALGLSADGTLRLRLVGGGGARVRIEWSSDLQQWERLTELTDTVGGVEFSDPASPGQAHRFYRARLAE